MDCWIIGLLQEILRPRIRQSYNPLILFPNCRRYFTRDFQVLRPRRCDGQQLAGDGMWQGQFLRVQRGAGNQRALLASGLEPEIAFQPREPELFATVKLVADNRKSAWRRWTRIWCARSMSGWQRSSVQPENRSSTSNCVFDFLPFCESTHIKPGFTGCGASLASISNFSSGGFPCASAMIFLTGFPELNKFASATSAGLFFASRNTPLVSKSGRWALLK